MATAEEAAQINARVEALGNTIMMQIGALPSAKTRPEAHREELTRMMKDLHETIVHTAALSAKVEEPPAARVPPGVDGADLRVTPA